MPRPKGPYKSSRPATSRASLARAPLMVTPPRRAALVSRAHAPVRSPPLMLRPLHKLGSPYRTPSPPRHRPKAKPRPPPRLDAQAHPQLIAQIMAWSCPAVLRAFRATASAFRRRADALLAHHLLITASAGGLEIRPLRPAGGRFVSHGRHPALLPSSPATQPDSRASGGFFTHDPGTVTDLRLAVARAAALQGVLARTEVIDVAGLSAQAMRQLRASAANAQLYRVHLAENDTRLLAEFDAGKRVTLALHLSPGLGVPQPRVRGLAAVRRLVINVPLALGVGLPAPAWWPAEEAGSKLEVVVVPDSLETADGDAALRALRAAYATGVLFALWLTAGAGSITCLGLGPGALGLGLTDAEVAFLLRLELGRLEAAALALRGRSEGDRGRARRALENVRFATRASYVGRIGAEHFALETAGLAPLGGGISASPSFVLVEPEDVGYAPGRRARQPRRTACRVM